MKTLIILTVTLLAAALVKADLKEEVLEIAKICAADNKVSDEELKKLQELPHGSKYDATDDVKCMTKCFAEKMKFINEDKTVNVDRVVEVNKAKGRDESVVRPQVEKCKEQVKGDFDCANAWNMFACVHEA